jgi:PTS system galactitol-specific IIA component
MSNSFDLDQFRVNEALVALHLQARTMDEAVRQLADIFIREGYVKPSYTAAALEREMSCPTGLPTPGLGTAIPHAGVEHTLKPGIAVATLAKPVKFGELGDPTSLIDVSVVFMLSVTQPDAQVYLLQSVIELYKDEALLRRLHEATDASTIVAEVNAALDRVNSERKSAR